MVSHPGASSDQNLDCFLFVTVINSQKEAKKRKGAGDGDNWLTGLTNKAKKPKHNKKSDATYLSLWTKQWLATGWRLQLWPARFPVAYTETIWGLCPIAEMFTLHQACVFPKRGAIQNQGSQIAGTVVLLYRYRNFSVLTHIASSALWWGNAMHIYALLTNRHFLVVKHA